MCRLLGCRGPRSMPGVTGPRRPPRPAAGAGGPGPDVFAAGRGAYGCRRVTAQLNRDGHRCSVGLAADLMRELGLRACQPRAYKRTTVPGEEPVTSPDLIGRDFTAPGPGHGWWATSPTCSTGEGWLYLATVIDLATRMVVRLAAGGAYAHQPGHRRPGHGHRRRPRPARRDLPLRQGRPAWIQPVVEHLDLEVGRWDDDRAGRRQRRGARDAVSGAAAGGAAGAPAAVLGAFPVASRFTSLPSLLPPPSPPTPPPLPLLHPPPPLTPLPLAFALVMTVCFHAGPHSSRGR